MAFFINEIALSYADLTLLVNRKQQVGVTSVSYEENGRGSVEGFIDVLPEQAETFPFEFDLFFHFENPDSRTIVRDEFQACKVFKRSVHVSCEEGPKILTRRFHFRGLSTWKGLQL